MSTCNEYLICVFMEKQEKYLSGYLFFLELIRAQLFKTTDVVS